jgi:hypothetical protein
MAHTPPLDAFRDARDGFGEAIVMSLMARICVAIGAAVALTLLTPGAVHADEPGESDEAKVLVLQAIALIVNTPDDMMAIEERIGDALEAPHVEGVDLDMVEQAAAALDAGDHGQARDLLQSAIGAGPYVGTGVPGAIREASGEPGAPAYAVGAQAGTAVVLDAYQPEGGLDRGEVVLLVLSVSVLLGGALLSWRLRPADTVRQLRRAAALREP